MATDFTYTPRSLHSLDKPLVITLDAAINVAQRSITSDSLSSLAKTVPNLQGTDSLTNRRRAITAYLLEKAAHRVLEGRETELLRDVHYIPAAQSDILSAGKLQEDGWIVDLPQCTVRKGKIKLDIVYQGVLPYVQIRTTSPSAYPSTSSRRTDDKGRIDGTETATATALIVHGPGGAQPLRSGKRPSSTTSLRGDLKAYKPTRLSSYLAGLVDSFPL